MPIAFLNYRSVSILISDGKGRKGCRALGAIDNARLSR